MSVFQCHIPLLSPTPQPEQYAVEMAGKKRREKGEEKRKVCTVLLEAGRVMFGVYLCTQPGSHCAICDSDFLEPVY